MTRVGVSDEERAALRPVLINIGIDTNTRAAGASDDLADTVTIHWRSSGSTRLLRGGVAPR